MLQGILLWIALYKSCCHYLIWKLHLFLNSLLVRWEQRSSKMSQLECPNQVVMMSFSLTQWIPQPINRNNINRRKSVMSCVKGSLWVLWAQGFAKFFEPQCYICLKQSVSEWESFSSPCQCYEPAAFCLLGFYKYCPRLHLLQMLQLLVLMFLKWNDVTYLKAM